MSRLNKIAVCTDLATKSKSHGYAYAAWNASFPTFTKYGATSRINPFVRLKELSSSGVPGHFELIACIATMTPFKLEKQIHEHFKDRRSFGYRKEFFEVSVEETIAYFDLLAKQSYGSLTNSAPEQPLPQGQPQPIHAKMQRKQLEPCKNFEQPVTLNGITEIIRMVSTNTGQYYVLFRDLAAALTGEKNPSKLKTILENAKDKVNRNGDAKNSDLVKTKADTETLFSSLKNLKVYTKYATIG
jgi:hypothetical protein